MKPSTRTLTAAECRRRGLVRIAATAGILLAATAVGVWLDIDRRVASACFQAEAGWPLGTRQPWQWLYRYGTIPGIVLSIGALLAWGMSFAADRLAPWRRYALLIVLTSVIGAGILVNAVLKPYWGRPRPDQTVAYGGLWEYRDVHQPGTPGKGESFPCGHCTMGYVFVALFFIRRRAPKWALAGGTAGIVLGALLSAARILQGAHYLLDTLWSLGVIVLTAQVLYYWVLSVPANAGRAGAAAVMTRRQRRLLAASLVLAALVMTGAFATRRPFYRSFTDRFAPPPAGTTVVVRVNAAPSRFNVMYRGGNGGVVRIDSQGFGWAGFDFDLTATSRIRNENALTLGYDIRVGSYFSELRHGVTVTLPAEMEGKVAVRLDAPTAGRQEDR